MSLEPLTLVWAPIKGYPMWPSQIVDPAVCNNDKVLRAGKEGQLLVYYFGDHMFGWYPRETHGLKDFDEHHEQFSVPKAGKTKLFQTALDEAEAEKNDLGATAKRWKQSLTDEQIRSRKQAAAAAEASKSSPVVKKEAKSKHAAPPKEPKAAVKSAPEPARTGFDVFRSNIGASLDINELSVYQEMWDAMAADRKQYYDDLARSSDKKEVVKKGGKASAPSAPPRKPPGAFQLYSTSNKNLIRELGLSQKEFKVYLQGEWESAAAAVRAPFEREAMEKMNVYQSKRTEWILANPDAGAALSDKDDDVAADAFSVGEAEPLPEDDPRNHDYCEQCGRGGDLVCCDGCPASYHPKCLPVPKILSELPDHWFCHICSASRGSAVDSKPSTADVKKKANAGPPASPAQQQPADLKRERYVDEDTVSKRAKSERDSSNGIKGRSHNGDAGVSRPSGDDTKSGWGSRAVDAASTQQRDARAPEAETPRLSESPRFPPNSRLFISGVNCGMAERDLALEIKKFGKIAEQFRFKPGAAFVHVQMATAEDAHRAMIGLKNYRYREREPPLNVKIADPRPLSSSDRFKAEAPPVTAGAANGSEKLLPGMSKSDVEGVLHRLGFDRNTACLEDVRRLRDELNDLVRVFDQQCSELTNMRSTAATEMEAEKNHELRSKPRHLEVDIRRHYEDLKRRLDIEVEDNRESYRKAHRNAQTNWKRKRQSVLGSHQVPCFIDQALPSRDMWTTIDHAWAYLDRCAPSSEPRREPTRDVVPELLPRQDFKDPRLAVPGIPAPTWPPVEYIALMLNRSSGREIMSRMMDFTSGRDFLLPGGNYNAVPPQPRYEEPYQLPPRFEEQPTAGWPVQPLRHPPPPPAPPYRDPHLDPNMRTAPRITGRDYGVGGGGGGGGGGVGGGGGGVRGRDYADRPDMQPGGRDTRPNMLPTVSSDDIAAALAHLEGLVNVNSAPAAAAAPGDYSDLYKLLQND